MASHSLETCSHHQVLRPGIVRSVISFTFTQGNKGTEGAGEEHMAGKFLQWKYNFTDLRPQPEAFPLFPKMFKAKAVHTGTKERLEMVHFPSWISLARWLQNCLGYSCMDLGLSSLHPAQSGATKEMCPQAIRPCWNSWLCPNLR